MRQVTGNDLFVGKHSYRMPHFARTSFKLCTQHGNYNQRVGATVRPMIASYVRRTSCIQQTGVIGSETSNKSTRDVWYSVKNMKLHVLRNNVGVFIGSVS
jgi:hypothetical protein